jgi:hypothetical protein
MVGGISALNELIGYPNIKAWDNEAFVIWGADVTLANLTIGELTQKFVDQFALQDKGPSQKTIYNRFGSFGAYNNLVLQELRQREKHKTKVLTKIKCVLSQDGLLGQLDDFNDQEVLMIGGKYLLAKIILNKYGYKSLPESLLIISRNSEKQFIKELKQLCKKISNQDIEHTALELDVFDYVYDELADTIASKHRLD